MTLGRFGGFFGDDWDDTLDSIKSVPGAFGNIALASIEQIRPFDVACLGLVVAGWVWIIAAFMTGHEMRPGVVGLALLPGAIWMAVGAAGAIIFEVGGIGPRVLRYWESYMLIAFFSLFGTISLRLALNPKDRLVFRNPGPTSHI